MLWSSIGLPATHRNCFSSFDPVRDPLPAATMITPTSRFISREAGGGRREAENRRRREGSRAGHRCCRFPPPASCLPPYPLNSCRKRSLIVRTPTISTPRIVAGAYSLRCSVSSFRREALNFDEHRPSSFEERSHRAAGGIVQAIAEEKLRWILDGKQTFLSHPEDSDLVDASESVLGRAKDAMLEHPFSLEVQHRIDDVLERLGAGYTAAFGDVADREHGGLGLLGE